jgi:hypothetical protein
MASPTIKLSSGPGFVIAFRGDDREPRVIFITGFTRRTADGPILYRKDDRSFPGSITALKPGDIEPDSAVTFSRRMRVATMFPLREDSGDPAVSDTYIYMVAVEANKIYNTHQKQVEDGLRGLDQWGDWGNTIDDMAARVLMWPLYAQEMATINIPSTDIVAAMACRRTWRGPNYKSGLTYTLRGDILWNPQCALPRGLRNTASQFLEREVADQRAGASPETESGYGQ